MGCIGNYAGCPSRARQISPTDNNRVVDKQVIQYILKILKPGAKDIIETGTEIPEGWEDIVSGYKKRDTTVEPILQKQSLLQLWLRSILGLNARAEKFLFLSLEKIKCHM